VCRSFKRAAGGRFIDIRHLAITVHVRGPGRLIHHTASLLDTAMSSLPEIDTSEAGLTPNVLNFTNLNNLHGPMTLLPSGVYTIVNVKNCNWAILRNNDDGSDVISGSDAFDDAGERVG
jgi:hypothetical protein